VVVVGRTDLRDRIGQRVGVTAIRVHPRYDGGTFDAALLRLSRSVSVRAVPLARAADNALEREGTPLVIAGWGVTTPILGYPGSTTRLKRADVNAWSDSRCSQTNSVNGFEPSTEMCADRLLTDSCYGDSGGPLFYERSGRLVQVGIVSYGLGCATPGFPGVYAEINNPSIANFIRGVTGVRVG
jgi:trypsin